MCDLPCTQLTPQTVYPATPAIRHVAVRCDSGRYSDDTLVRVAPGYGDGLLYVPHNLENLIPTQKHIHAEKLNKILADP